jgi:hypothetical protein
MDFLDVPSGPSGHRGHRPASPDPGRRVTTACVDMWKSPEGDIAAAGPPALTPVGGPP